MSFKIVKKKVFEISRKKYYDLNNLHSLTCSSRPFFVLEKEVHIMIEVCKFSDYILKLNSSVFRMQPNEGSQLVCKFACGVCKSQLSARNVRDIFNEVVFVHLISISYNES